MKKNIILLLWFLLASQIVFTQNTYDSDKKIINGYGKKETDNFYEFGHFVNGKLQGLGIKYNSRASLKDGTKILNHCEMGNYVNGKLQGLGFLLNETNEKLGGTNMDVWSVCNFENGEKNGYIYTGNNKVLKMITNFENKKVTENLIFRTDCYYYQNEKYPELRMLSSNLTNDAVFLYINKEGKKIANKQDFAFINKILESLEKENIITNRFSKIYDPTIYSKENYMALCKQITANTEMIKADYYESISLLKKARILYSKNENSLVAKYEWFKNNETIATNKQSNNNSKCVVCNGSGKKNNEECGFCNGTGHEVSDPFKNIDFTAKSKTDPATNSSKPTYKSNNSSSSNTTSTTKQYSKCTGCNGQTGQWVKLNWKKGFCDKCEGKGKIETGRKKFSNGYDKLYKKETFYYEYTYEKCNTCNGTGNKFEWVDCSKCKGTGVE